MALNLDTARGVFESSGGEWVLILGMVFGGCCSNVWALEAVLKDHPRSGTFLTFAQIVYVTLQTISSQVYFPPRVSEQISSSKPLSATASIRTPKIEDAKNLSSFRSKGHGGRAGDSTSWSGSLRLRLPRWRKNVVPLRRWMIQVVLFLSVSLINNYVFGLKIPLTVHIIFRSGGLCVSMLTGYFMAGKRYSVGQVLAGIMITIGIILATISAPRNRPPPPSATITTSSACETTTSGGSASVWTVENMHYFAGIALLSFALFLSAWLGLVQERTYAIYGKPWREALFYSHFLSLPFFIPLYPTLSTSFRSFALSPPIALMHIPTPTLTPIVHLLGLSDLPKGAQDRLIEWRALLVPSALVALGVNVITQGFCVRGVNRLTSRVNSVTVNLILTVRKAVSLAISVWYYGHGVTAGLLIGGSLVLVGTIVYSIAQSPVPASTLPPASRLMNKKATSPDPQLAVEGNRTWASRARS